jgi:hypothetical protein
VLKSAPENGEAFLGLAMVENKCRDREELRVNCIKRGTKLRTSRNIDRACRFSSRLNAWFDEVEKERAERAEKARIALNTQIDRMTKVRKKLEKAQKMIAADGYHTVGLRRTEL